MKPITITITKYTIFISLIALTGCQATTNPDNNLDSSSSPESTSQTIDTNTKSLMDETSPQTVANTFDNSQQMNDQMNLLEYQYQANLTDVNEGNATGEAKATYENDTYYLFAEFKDLPDPEGTDFYEGWVVRKDPLSVISTGKAEKINNIYHNIFVSDQDLTDHNLYVLTIEPDDGDPAPADHVLDGTLEKAK